MAELGGEREMVELSERREMAELSVERERDGRVEQEMYK
jgi:hypothetical protein